MTLTFIQELSLIITLTTVLVLPGSAILMLSGIWRRWTGLQRPFIAVGLSLFLYPILFYTTRNILPQFQVNRWILLGLLLVALLVAAWYSWKEQPFLRTPEKGEWIALLILGLTFASRFWFAHINPFPAWSDSLHHTILTQLTAEGGALPNSLQPFFPNTLEMYHLGLYSLSGTVQIITQLPAHASLLWTAQFLNALCGIGIYVLLDRYVGRTAALIGLAMAGLFSHHPALWANWGRFTQLASVVTLPLAWVLFLDALLPSEQEKQKAHGLPEAIWVIVFATAGAAAVFLFHFRVGIFYLFLLAVSTIYALWARHSRAQRLSVLRQVLLIAAIYLLIILPTLWDALGAFSSRAGSTLSASQREQLLQNYFVIELSAIPHLVARPWILAITAVAGIIGLIRRNVFTTILLLWVLLLVGVGNLYLLEIPALNFTNLGAVLIMLYIPISIIIGVGLEEGLQWIPKAYLGRARTMILAFLVAAALLATYMRATMVVPYRHFVTKQDLAAMEWIEMNTPPDAIFAINTSQWLPNFYHGTDAGYWIPYLTQRGIVTTSMLSDGLPREYRQLVLERSSAAEALESDLSALTTLYDLGVEYIYIGAIGDFSGPGLNPEFLRQADSVQLLYQEGDVAILGIGPPSAQQD